MNHDERVGFVGGNLVSINEGQRLFYLGGINPNITDESSTKLIYEFGGSENRWKVWKDYELPVPVFNTSVIPIPNSEDAESFCSHTKRVQLINNFSEYFNYHAKEIIRN